MNWRIVVLAEIPDSNGRVSPADVIAVFSWSGVLRQVMESTASYTPEDKREARAVLILRADRQ